MGSCFMASNDRSGSLVDPRHGVQGGRRLLVDYVPSDSPAGPLAAPGGME
jgi:hypothetical protein